MKLLANLGDDIPDTRLLDLILGRCDRITYL